MRTSGLTAMAFIAATTCFAMQAEAATQTKRRQAPQQAKAAIGTRFDLECSGMQHNWNSDAPGAWKEVFRVDMKANRWCRGRCGATQEIGKVDDDRLVLPDSRANSDGPEGAEAVLSRMDGEIKERVMIGTPGQSRIMVEGFCVKTPFSGFGERKF